MEGAERLDARKEQEEGDNDLLTNIDYTPPAPLRQGSASAPQAGSLRSPLTGGALDHSCCLVTPRLPPARTHLDMPDDVFNMQYGVPLSMQCAWVDTVCKCKSVNVACLPQCSVQKCSCSVHGLTQCAKASMRLASVNAVCLCQCSVQKCRCSVHGWIQCAKVSMQFASVNAVCLCQ